MIASCVHVDEFAFLPVTAGMWRQHELWDGTYTLDDLLDAVEVIRVKRENENRAMEARL
ncbi:MAG: 4-alpha-glucanotransferase [Clostridia bacterium]